MDFVAFLLVSLVAAFGIGTLMGILISSRYKGVIGSFVVSVSLSIVFFELQAGRSIVKSKSLLDFAYSFAMYLFYAVIISVPAIPGWFVGNRLKSASGKKGDR